MFVELFLSLKLKEGYFRWLIKKKKSSNIFRFDLKEGTNAYLASQEFVNIFCLYPDSFAFIIVALTIKFFEIHFPNSVYPESLITGVLLSAIFIFVVYIPVKHAVFSDEIYVEYFKKFAKKDEEWHRKWSIRTIIFIVGGIVSMIVGIILGALVLFLL